MRRRKIGLPAPLSGRRKTGRAGVAPIVGGVKVGVVVVEPGGRSTIVPFTGDGEVFHDDGTFKPVTPVVSVAWGDITGTLEDQTDLKLALDAKQDTLVFNSALCAYVLNAP